MSGVPPPMNVGNNSPGKVIGAKVSLGERFIAKFGKYQTTEKTSGTASKPFVNTNDRPIILLNLFLPQRQSGNQGNVKGVFNGHVLDFNDYLGGNPLIEFQG
jgi:hypothetical protein